MLYYELQALLQHNYNLAVAYLALVATRYYTITTGCNKVTTRLQTNYYWLQLVTTQLQHSCYSDMIATQNCNLTWL